MNKKILLIVLLIMGVNLSADLQDKWKVSMGGMFVTNFETDMQLTPKGLPVAAKINSKDQLGMKNDTSVFRLDGYYRFNNIHSIDFSYFRVTSNGEKVINQDITWEDKTISAGASIKSYFDMDVYKVNYGYSFYHNEKVELMLTAGLHITGIGLGLKASGIVDGNATSAYSSSAGATIPLPVVGFKGEYTIIDKKLFVHYRSEYFILQLENVKGRLLSSALNIEYRFVDHVSVGLGYNANNIYVSAEDTKKKFEVENRLSGAMFYLSYVY